MLIMRSSRTLAAAAAMSATMVLGVWRTSRVAPDACSLLTEAEVSAAIEVKSQAGQHLVPSSQTVCIWTNDQSNKIANRRVTLSITRMDAFERGKTPFNKQIKIEPVSGIGDEAYYEIFTADSPILVVKKGSTAFSVRILNALEKKSLTHDQEKAKEADLAKAAAGRL